jgi:hypothetical protein
MTADTLGSIVEAGKKPADNSNEQYWENLIPAALRNMQQESATDMYSLVAGGLGGFTQPTWASGFFFNASAAGTSAYFEFTVGDCTGGQDVKVGDFFAFYVAIGSIDTAASGACIYINHNGRLDQATNGILAQSSDVFDGVYYTGLSGVVTGTDLTADKKMRFGVGCDGVAALSQNYRLEKPTVIWKKAGVDTISALVPPPIAGNGVCALKSPARITISAAGAGVWGAAGSDFPAIAENLTGIAVADSWGNEYSGGITVGVTGDVIKEWCSKLGLMKDGFSIYCDTKGGRGLIGLHEIIDNGPSAGLLTLDANSTDANEISGFGGRRTYDRPAPDFFLIQGMSFNSLKSLGQSAAQMLVTMDLCVVAIRAAGIPLIIIGNMTGGVTGIIDAGWTLANETERLAYNAGLITAYGNDSDIRLVNHNEEPISTGDPVPPATMVGDTVSFLNNQMVDDAGHLDEVGSQLVADSYFNILFPSSSTPTLGTPYSPVQSIVKSMVGSFIN